MTVRHLAPEGRKIINLLGFDYSTPIEPTAVKATGTRVVFRYLAPPGWPKHISRAEYQGLTAAGIRVVLNYETTADMMADGYAGGIQAARLARGYARDIGAPDSDPIIYSDDTNLATVSVNRALEFLAGAASVEERSRVGAYGPYAFVSAAIDVGYRGWGTVAWSDGQHDPRAMAWQTGEQTTVGGVTVDINDLNPNYDFGRHIMSGKIPASIAARWPEMASEFPAGADFDSDNALIWADAGARKAAEGTEAILTILQAMRQEMTTIQATLAGIGVGTADPGATAAAIVSHIHVD